MKDMSIKNETLREAYDGSYYTITGTGGNISEWKNGYASMLKDEGIGKVRNWIQFTGKDMNDEFGLTNSNRYPDDLNFLAFPLDGLDVAKLSLFRIAMHDRWFDDIADRDMETERECRMAGQAS